MLLNRKKGNAKPSMSFISLEMNDIKKGHKKLNILVLKGKEKQTFLLKKTIKSIQSMKLELNWN